MRLVLAILVLWASTAFSAIALVGRGGNCSVTAASTCTVGFGTLPGADTDVLIIVMHTRVNEAHSCSTNCTGWTEFSTQAGDATGGRLSVWWYRISGSLPSAPVFAAVSSESHTATVWEFSGVEVSGNPYDVVSTNDAEASASTYTGNSVTTVTDNAMLVFAVGSMDNNQWGTSGGGCTMPTGGNTVYYNNNGQGSDNSVAICVDAVAVNTAPTALTAPTYAMTAVGPDAGRSFTFALKDCPTCGGNSMMGIWGRRARPVVRPTVKQQLRTRSYPPARVEPGRSETWTGGIGLWWRYSPSASAS